MFSKEFDIFVTIRPGWSNDPIVSFNLIKSENFTRKVRSFITLSPAPTNLQKLIKDSCIEDFLFILHSDELIFQIFLYRGRLHFFETSHENVAKLTESSFDNVSAWVRLDLFVARSRSLRCLSTSPWRSSVLFRTASESLSSGTWTCCC
jgi:hypothetical protein